MLIASDFDGAFEVDAARALHENDIAGAKVFDEPLAGGFGVVEEDGRDSSGASRSGKMFGIALNGDDEIEAGLRGGAAAGGVQRRAMLTHFKHLAGDKDAPASCGAGGEGTNHGAERLGVGVIAVIQDGGAGDFDHLHRAYRLR